ncbi:MAG: MBL fold metallo-hydrolase [Herpetosiphonaceae bacterium]|nr:MBL fold metallo-hydrolase [Herpetosiphonaceae bacterium]
MIEPLLKDRAFLADVAQARQAHDQFHLWWLGQSGFLVQWQDRHLLLDPYLSDSLTAKYAATDKPHVRMTARVIAPQQLDFVDIVTSSHNHTDHLDAETLIPILQANPAITLVIPEANRAFVADRLRIDPVRPVGVDDGLTVEVNGFHITGIASAHETVERDTAGHAHFLGYVVRFGPWSIYHSGDTMRYDGMAERLRPYAPLVALLPINGHAPERRVPGNLDGREAAQLAKDIGASVVIPCHYGMFAFNTASPEHFVAEAQRLGQPYHLLRAGECWSSPSIPA